MASTLQERQLDLLGELLLRLQHLLPQPVLLQPPGGSDCFGDRLASPTNKRFTCCCPSIQSYPRTTGALGLSTFAVLLYNIFGMVVTDNVGAAARVVLENARTLLVWLVREEGRGGKGF